MIIARSFDVVVNGIISFFPDGWGISHCIYVPHLVYPLICPQAFTLVLFLITFLLQHLLFPPLGWNQLGYSSEISDLKLMSRRGVGQRGGGGGMENSKWVGLQPSNLVSPISRGLAYWGDFPGVNSAERALFSAVSLLIWFLKRMGRKVFNSFLSHTGSTTLAFSQLDVSLTEI